MSKRKISEAETSKLQFEPAAFLETVAKGRIIAAHRKRDIIFAQGDDADAVFYIRKGKIKITVLSKQGKEAVVAILVPMNLWAKGA
jgi:CRP/FNR family transcriptional regulator, cyclic AMP receptor protein